MLGIEGCFFRCMKALAINLERKVISFPPFRDLQVLISQSEHPLHTKGGCARLLQNQVGELVPHTSFLPFFLPVSPIPYPQLSIADKCS